ncbi:MAG: hypothetical protein KAJ45_03935 [Desulfobulbaceae bacterium]|nr:hypothetical protein [Desulfobulbaceae bacterium]
MAAKNRVGISIFGILCLVLFLTGCFQKQAVQKSAEPAQVQPAEEIPPPETTEPPAEAGPEVRISQEEAAKRGVYNIIVKALSINECGRCHNSHFKRLKNNGSRHQKVTCTDCHELFHAYNPLKENYAEIMPSCSSCHDDPHGTAEAVTKCLNCHTDPHQPIVTIPEASNLESQCRICHGKVAKSLLNKPSKHTDEDCSSCHSDNHGRIPDCSECHESHSPSVALNNPDCMACHPVHTPLVITYPQNQDNTVCAGCHTVVHDELQANVTKHTALPCAQCHPSHAQLMACSDCHTATPHSASIHQKFLKCGSCHNTAHDLHM